MKSVARRPLKKSKKGKRKGDTDPLKNLKTEGAKETKKKGLVKHKLGLWAVRARVIVNTY